MPALPASDDGDAMTELRVVGKRRRYTKRQKVTAVIAAEMTSTSAAARSLGANESTVRYWMDDPAFAIYREKTREDLAAGSLALANQALSEIKRRIAEFEPRDLTVLVGVLTDKAQLLSGQATARTEHRDLTDGLDDDELERLREGIDRLAKVEA